MVAYTRRIYAELNELSAALQQAWTRELGLVSGRIDSQAINDLAGAATLVDELRTQ
jgi:hypothetical protein